MSETIYGGVPLSSIIRSRFQMRKVFDKPYISKLGVSIKNHGLLAPIMVWRVPVPENLPEGVVPITAPDGTRYCNELIYGECRELGAKEAGLTEIPALTVTGITEREVRIYVAIENINRKDLTFVEEARCFKSMLDDGLSQEDIAKEVKYDPSYISYSLKLLGLPEALLEKLSRDNFFRSHAIQLTRLPSAALQEKVFDAIISKNLSVVAASKLVDKLAAAPEQADDIIAGHTAKETKPEADGFKITVIKPKKPAETQLRHSGETPLDAGLHPSGMTADLKPVDDVKPPAPDAQPSPAAASIPAQKPRFKIVGEFFIDTPEADMYKALKEERRKCLAELNKPASSAGKHKPATQAPKAANPAELEKAVNKKQEQADNNQEEIDTLEHTLADFTTKGKDTKDLKEHLDGLKAGQKKLKAELAKLKRQFKSASVAAKLALPVDSKGANSTQVKTTVSLFEKEGQGRFKNDKQIPLNPPLSKGETTTSTPDQLEQIKKQSEAFARGDWKEAFKGMPPVVQIPQIKGIMSGKTTMLARPGLSEERRQAETQQLMSLQAYLDELLKAQPQAQSGDVGGFDINKLTKEQLETWIAQMEGWLTDPTKSDTEKATYKLWIGIAQARLDTLRNGPKPDESQPESAG